MVFYPPPDPPPRRPPPGGKLREEEEESWSAERIHTVAMETLSWCTKKYKGVTRSDQVGVPYIIVGVMMVTGFGVLGLVAALPTKSRAFMVNTWGFLLPALATIGEIDQAKDHRSKPPSVFTGYWVLFGLLSLLDEILPVITPCYFFTKACVLAWAASSARPYGGRLVINRAFEIINGKSGTTSDSEYKPLREVLTVIKALGPSEDVAAQAGIPRRAFRLAVFTVAVAARTFALGIVSSLVLAAEGLFSGLSTWTQARICVIAGASWPLYATLLARARSAAAAAAERSGDTEDDKTRRLGPAAVQWLSYWPMFALFLAVLDPVMGWVPHFYSFKLVALAFLALPQTRGAYLITSLVLYGEDGSTDSSPASSVDGDYVKPSFHEGREEQKISRCNTPDVVVPVD